jgi:uncharacterized membrane protein
MAGTVNNHGISAKIISIIQMLQAWVKVTLAQVTQDSMLQDIIKVIMVAISIMTINRTAMVIKTTAPSEEEVEAVVTGMVQIVVGTVMARMSPSHKITSRLVQPKHLLGQ